MLTEPFLPQPHCCHGDEYHTESSRGSDLSDIMEEDEEELCSEMQLEGGRRRPSGTSHSALKVSAAGPQALPAAGGRAVASSLTLLPLGARPSGLASSSPLTVHPGIPPLLWV